MESLCWRGRARLHRAGCSSSVSTGSRTGGRDMDVDLPEVHARALDATRAVRSPAWATTSGTIVSDCDDWTVRELVNHIVTGNYWAAELGVGATPSRRSATGSTATCSATDPLRAYDDSAAAWPRRCSARPGAMDAPCAVSYGPVPGIGLLRAPVPRRAHPRVGRRHVDRAGHHARSRAGRGVLGRWSSRSSTCSWPAARSAPGSRCPTTPSRQTKLLAVLGRRRER